MRSHVSAVHERRLESVSSFTSEDGVDHQAHARLSMLATCHASNTNTVVIRRPDRACTVNAMIAVTQ
eukprot:CAMPEP_0119497130 /NCGR_PEP_ID=MMETSP1344-20130328/20269_1 /TAXON_ID=236787 /ORGANISM="Florenciella parvula, Strain CCMP2471" /LENGTH=66 /DNA_ID=CAMNT_0007532893 /DNA_START=43 /DNA_END=243 /DNA_ORIENTATION=+